MQTRRKPHATPSAIARALVVVAFGLSTAWTQAPPPTADATMAAAAERLCRANDPVVRGEAALVLATQSLPKHHLQILITAKDPAPEARLRGLLALGILGAPGSEHLLREQVEASSTRPQPEGVVAAFALGCLPDQQAAAIVSDQLARFLSASSKRQHDVGLALVLGLTTHPAPSQRLALQSLLAAKSVRDVDLRIALLLALARIPNGLDDGEWAALLASGSAEERRTVLACAPTLSCAALLQPAAVVACTRDSEPAVRAQALAALTQMRHPGALDLARKMLASAAPDEAGQAARTLWQLGGSAVAAEFAPILQRAQPATQTALLAEYGGLLPAATATLVHKLATDRAQPPTLRAAAALALGKSCLLDASADSAYQERVATVLRDAFVASSSSAALSQLAPVLLRLHATPPPLASLQAGNHPMDLALSPERLLALLLAVHPAAEPFCVSVVDTKGQSAAALQGVLRAWRSRPLMTVLPESTARLLPSPLRELR